MVSRHFVSPLFKQMQLNNFFCPLVEFVGGWRQELTMILLLCPYFPNTDKSIIPLIFNKRVNWFFLTSNSLMRLMKKTTLPSAVKKSQFRMTDVSQEIIDEGFAPFDIKIKHSTNTLKKSNCRENLKLLVKWLCEEFTTPEKIVPGKFDLLNGKSPTYYGFPNIDSKSLHCK